MSAETKNPSIRARENGPLVVSNLTRLRNSRGEDLDVQETIALCRCGGSANKPFCDGTHRNNGFSDENLSDPQPLWDLMDGRTASPDRVHER